ncbi:MAG: hypothetical protein BJ554DRAFT_5072, partial [Olpidium bornovanus]
MAELSKVDMQVASLNELYPELVKLQAENSRPVRALNLHSNSLLRVDGDLVHALVGLADLDLSSNELESLDGIQALTRRENRRPHLRPFSVVRQRGACLIQRDAWQIRQITHLNGLQALEWLSLSFNYIEKLDGLVELHGSHHSLQYLDLKGNFISDINQIKFLAGCPVCV